MINILLNISNFDEGWAYPSLENILTPDKKVLMLPLSYDEDEAQILATEITEELSKILVQ